ncbi:MAG: restriction endonuclease subunit S [Methylomicrobium sp.]
MTNKIGHMKYWPRVKFGEVVRLSKTRSADPLAERLDRYVGLEHLEPGDLRIRSWGNVAEGTTFTNVFRPGQVLFGKRRAYQRKVAVADFMGVCSGDIYVLETKDAQVLLPELLPFICQTDAFFDHAVGTSAGSLSPRTNWTSLADFEFALPSLSDQVRILACVNAIREVIESHEAVVFEARRLLQAGIRSRLEELESAPQYPTASLGGKNEDVLKTGPFGSNLKSSYFINEGVPVLSIGSLGEDGIIESELFHLAEEVASRFDDYRVREGDVVFSRVADVGRCHLITTKERGYIISSNLIRIRMDPEKMMPGYLILLLKHSRLVRDQIARMTTQAAGRLLVNTQTLAKLRFPIPSMSEQRVLVELKNDLREGIDLARTHYAETRELLEPVRDRLLLDGGQDV